MLSALYPMLVLPTLHSSAFRNAQMGPSAQLVSRPATRRSRKRPRGIWKTRKPVAAQAFVERLSHHQRAQHDIDLSEDEAEDAASTSTASSRKRRRTDSHDTSSSEPSVSSASLTSSPATSFYEVPQSQSAMNGVLAIVESKAGKQDCNLTDWEELKALFAEAAERYECDEAPTAMRLLRSVMQECNRFMSVLPNPSVLFVPGAFTPRHGGKDKQRSQDDYFARIRSSTLNTVQTELPTAFHIILGITLFLFGNLVEQDVSLLRPGEPTSSLVYWLAALDVFETAESLPCRTSGSSDAEGWRMAVVWGRTLIRVAEATIYLTRTDPSARLPVHEPKWPSDSIFRAIAAARPPLTRRRSLSIATPNEILILAMDQLSRGIFHMPHPFYRHNAPTAAVATFCASPALKSKHLPQTLTPSTHSSLEFSRPKELFTIASEVLGVAEKLSSLSDRRYWALWADTVFEQMKMEAADAVIWRGRIAGLRGKCWLVAASVWVDPIEEALERGDVGVLDNTDAVVSRDGYQKAVDFFEQSKTCGVLDAEIQPMFVEALLSLANLTPDEAAREELYARAEAEGGEFMLDNTIDKS